MRKGCLRALLIYAALVAAYAFYGSPHWDPPATWIIPIVAGGISFLAIGGLWTAWDRWRDLRLISQAMVGVRPRDEQRAAAIGRIFPVGEPLKTPFSQSDAVFYEYGILKPGSKADDTTGIGVGGFRMERCVVRGDTLETIVLGLPDLNQEPARECRSLKSYIAARELVERTEFVDMTGKNVVRVFSQIFDVMSDDDGSVDSHWRRSHEVDAWLHCEELNRLCETFPGGEVPQDANADEPPQDDDDEEIETDDDLDLDDEDDELDEGFGRIRGAPTLVEKYVAPGDEVAMFGWYSMEKGGIAPNVKRRAVAMRMLRGSPAQIESQLRGSIKGGLFGGLIALVVLHLALWGGTTLYRNDSKTIQRRTSELDNLLRKGDVEAVRQALASGRHYDLSKSLLSVRNTPELVPLLVVHGADLTATDQYGVTPLMEAARYGRVAMTKALLEAGAPVDQRSGQSNRTALMMAIDSMQDETAALLRAAGARDDTVTAANGEPVVGEDAGPIVACVKYVEAIHARDAVKLAALSARARPVTFDDVEWDVWHNTRPVGEVEAEGFANETAATMTVRGTAPKGFQVTWVFQLVQEDGQWKILRENWAVKP